MPNTKVGAGGIGGALASIIVWGVSLAGVDVPAEVAAAFATVVSFAVGYLVPEKSQGGTLPS
jgi:hypothetical protein